MGSIKTSDAQGLTTKKLIEVYVEREKPQSFIRSFFPTDTVPTREISIEVQRGFRKMAFDVQRGSDGVRNSFGKSTEKIFEPPYYNEYFDATKIDLYDQLYGVSSVDSAVFSRYINNVTDKVLELQYKIERTYEKQAADALLTGIMDFDAAGKIDFKRKAGSKVDLGAGQYFTSAIDPFAKFQAGCEWIKINGKTGSGAFNAICGQDALAALFANAEYKARQDHFNWRIDSVSAPQRKALGNVYHGSITAGPYTVHLWSYPEYYQDKAGADQQFIDPKKIILLPEDASFKLAFGAIPQLIEPGSMPVMGDFIFSDYVDKRKKTHDYVVESCGVPIITQVDKIYTFKAIGG